MHHQKNVRGTVKPSFSNPSEYLLTGQQIAARLALENAASVYELTRSRCKNPLPHIKVGKYLRFYWPAIEQWISQQEVAL